MIETDALIVGAGPVGLYQVFQLGLLGIHCHVVDALPHPGGQCAELYPDKPIYDIPGVPSTTGRDLVSLLMTQIAPFTRNGSVQLHYGQLVSVVQRLAEGRFQVETSTGQTFITKTLFIAAGAGAFVPRKLRGEGLDLFEGRQLFYRLPDSLNLAGKHLVIQGDDDNALGWAVEHAQQRKARGAGTDGGAPASVTLIHRREVFTANTEQVERMNALRSEGQLRFVAGQITAPVTAHIAAPISPQASAPAANDELRLTGLQLALPDGSTEMLPTDALLASLGVSPKLGPLAEWGLALLRKQVPVDTEKSQTLEPGIFAVGDINTYPGKKKLIVCGFHECVLAAFGAAEIVFPGKPQLLQYTTTSTRLHGLLGVAHGT